MVVIGVCSGTLSRYAQFSASMMRLETPIDTRIAWQQGTNVAEGRNKIAARWKDEADYIWFLDDDHDVGAQTLPRLLAHRVDIVAPLCLLKEPPFHTVDFDLWDSGQKQGWPLELTPGLGGLVEVEAVGGAGMLVSTVIFKTLPPPWFELGQLHPEGMGEDTWFCRKAKASGFKVYVDLETPIGHLRPVGIWPRRQKDGAWTTEIRFSKDLSILIDTARKCRADTKETK